MLARDMSEEMQRKGTYPEATGLGFFGWGAPTFCLFWGVSGWGFTPRFLPARTPAGGGLWFKGTTSITMTSGIAEDGIGKA
jgi:hypothetical protein